MTAPHIVISFPWWHRYRPFPDAPASLHLDRGVTTLEFYSNPFVRPGLRSCHFNPSLGALSLFAGRHRLPLHCQKRMQNSGEWPIDYQVFSIFIYLSLIVTEINFLSNDISWNMLQAFHRITRIYIYICWPAGEEKLDGLPLLVSFTTEKRRLIAFWLMILLQPLTPFLPYMSSTTQVYYKASHEGHTWTPSALFYAGNAQKIRLKDCAEEQSGLWRHSWEYLTFVRLSEMCQRPAQNRDLRNVT